MRGRVARDESGFTLPEVLVAMLMMLTVMFALYSIFDTSLRVFSFGNNKTEAVQNARVGLERMEREIRAAYPYDKDGDGEDETLIDAPSDDTEIVFRNELDGDREAREAEEEIEYRVSADGEKLLRNTVAIVESLDSASFDYLDGDGEPCGPTNSECTGAGESRIVRIELAVEVEGSGVQAGTQSISTDVALRNRSR